MKFNLSHFQIASLLHLYTGRILNGAIMSWLSGEQQSSLIATWFSWQGLKKLPYRRDEE